MDRDGTRFRDGIQDAVRRATMRGTEPPDHLSFPRQTQLDAFSCYQPGHRRPYGVPRVDTLRDFSSRCT